MATKTKPQPKKLDPRKLVDTIWAHVTWDHDIPVPEDEEPDEPFDPTEW